MRELARAGLFLAADSADRGSVRQLLSGVDTRTVFALITTCGLYDQVGHFAARVGVPAKSGVSGAVLAIVPGQMVIACDGPSLGASGNSLAGVAILGHLAGTLALSVFASPNRGSP